jgi:hypothetical protein
MILAVVMDPWRDQSRILSALAVTRMTGNPDGDGNYAISLFCSDRTTQSSQRYQQRRIDADNVLNMMTKGPKKPMTGRRPHGRDDRDAIKGLAA